MKNEEMSLRTKQALAASLKRAVLKKPLFKISVRELIEDCGVNRKTFRCRFDDIYALVKRMLGQEAVGLVKQFDLASTAKKQFCSYSINAEANKHILNCSYLIAALSLSMNAVLFRLARLPLSAASHYMVRLKRNRLFQSQKSDRFVRYRQSGGSIAGVLPQMPSAAFEIGVVRLRLMMRPMLVKINHGCLWLLGKPCSHKTPRFS